MTHRAAGSRRAALRAWALPGTALALIALAVYFDWLSRSIALDFAAWWPVWALIALLGFLVRGRKLGRLRLSGLIPILALGVVAVFLYGHLAGWVAMPSSSVRLIGPGQGSVSTAALSARITGTLHVTSGESGFLYAVVPIRRGGDVALPDATEQIQGPSMSIQLKPMADPGLYTFAGWDLDLDPSPEWSLSLGGDLDADLSTLQLSSLQVAGDGRVELGTVSHSVPVTVSGRIEITLPSGLPARVVGDAGVPADWVKTNDGWESPTPGSGWVFSVSDSTTLSLATH
ncbi:MAG: hypothetical protein WA726_03030 [Acidimicrobiia bacterium]